MKTERTLYKLDNKGKTRIWHMEIDGAKYRTVSGVKRGKQTTSSWTTAKPKNVGRSNATTGETQAILEVAAKYKKKLEQGGYHENETTISEGSSYTEPMLAKTFNRHDKEVKGKTVSATVLKMPVYVQNKLDGIRCIAKWDTNEKRVKLWTRRGKPIVSVPHIADALTPAMCKHKELILDGELYAHHLKDDFQRITSLVRKQSTDSVVTDETVEVEYHCYDIVCDQPFMVRSYALCELLVGEQVDDKVVKYVGFSQALGDEDLDEFHAEAIEAGYEGSIIRLSPADSVYDLGKRSKNLWKRKDFSTDEFTIADILPGEGNRDHMAGKIVYFTHDGQQGFESGIRGDFDYFRELLDHKEKYIGCEATVRYFGLTNAGKPRHAVTIDIHEGARVD